MTTKKEYQGSALVKQEPAEKLTRAKEFTTAFEAGKTAIAKMASLLSKDLPMPALTQVYHVLNADWKKKIEGMRNACNEALKDWVVENAPRAGKVAATDSGGTKYEVPVDFGGEKFSAVATRAKAGTPTVKDLAAKLKAKFDAAGKEVTLAKCEEYITDVEMTRVYSKDKVAKLVAKGVLTLEDIEACCADGALSLKVEKL